MTIWNTRQGHNDRVRVGQSKRIWGAGLPRDLGGRAAEIMSFEHFLEGLKRRRWPDIGWQAIPNQWCRIVRLATSSYSSNVRVERVFLESTEPVIKFSDIRSYVTALYIAFWWLACVVNKFPKRNEIEVSFLHPHGPSRSFKYPHVHFLLSRSRMNLSNHVASFATRD